MASTKWDRLIDRIQAAVESGVIDVLWEPGAELEPIVALTSGELARLLVVLFPEEHPDPGAAAGSRTGVGGASVVGCAAPPGTREKIEVMSERVRMGVACCARVDADMRQARRRQAERTHGGSRHEVIEWWEGAPGGVEDEAG